MAITDSEIAGVLAAYLERYPHEAGQLAEALRFLDEGQGFASRRTLPMHVTAGALLVRGGTEVLLIEHRAYKLSGSALCRAAATSPATGRESP